MCSTGGWSRQKKKEKEKCEILGMSSHHEQPMRDIVLENSVSSRGSDEPH